MNNNHCRFLFVLFKARIIGIASSSASCKKGGIYSYKVEVTFAIDIPQKLGQGNKTGDGHIAARKKHE